MAEALTTIVRDHRPYGRWAHIRAGSDGTPNAADVRAEVARGRVLVPLTAREHDRAVTAAHGTSGCGTGYELRHVVIRLARRSTAGRVYRTLVEAVAACLPAPASPRRSR